MSAVAQIEADVVTEGRRLVGRAAAGQVPVRLLGGVAIRLHAPDDLPAAFCRSYKDLDFVAARGASAVAARFFEEAGYAGHAAFNALNGKERLLFFDEGNGRQLDVFVGSFRMCHAVPVADRLELETATIPLAELLLTKLQVVELNEKDVRDALALFHGHVVADEDREAVNAAVVASLCAEDWGLWRTITANLAQIRDRLGNYEIAAAEKAGIAGKVDRLLDRIEEEPKSRSWKLRAKIGDRKRWYEVPEEVEGGP